MSVPSFKFYILRFFRYSPDKIFKLKITTERSNQSHTMMLHTYTPPTNVPTKSQLPTPYGFWDTARTNFACSPPAHIGAMGESNSESNTHTSPKGCGVKSMNYIVCRYYMPQSIIAGRLIILKCFVFAHSLSWLIKF